MTADDHERAARQAHLQQAEADFEPLPFDAAAARGFGQVAASLRGAGRKPSARAYDAMIAGPAAMTPDTTPTTTSAATTPEADLSGTLPATGSSANGQLSWVVVLLVAGMLAVAASRRRIID